MLRRRVKIVNHEQKANDSRAFRVFPNIPRWFIKPVNLLKMRSIALITKIITMFNVSFGGQILTQQTVNNESIIYKI